MHIAPKNFEMHHSQPHIDLIAITRLVGHLDLHSKKSNSKRYFGAVFFKKKKIENQRNVFDLCVARPRKCVCLKALIAEDFLDTLNIQFRPQKSFYRPLKSRSSVKNEQNIESNFEISGCFFKK